MFVKVSSSCDDEFNFFISSSCWASRVAICWDGIVGCAGRDWSIRDVSLDLATEEGRVSGSKRALRIRTSLVESVVFGSWTAMILCCRS